MDNQNNDSITPELYLTGNIHHNFIKDNCRPGLTPIIYSPSTWFEHSTSFPTQKLSVSATPVLMPKVGRNLTFYFRPSEDIFLTVHFSNRYNWGMLLAMFYSSVAFNMSGAIANKELIFARDYLRELNDILMCSYGSWLDHNEKTLVQLVEAPNRPGPDAELEWTEYPVALDKNRIFGMHYEIEDPTLFNTMPLHTKSNYCYSDLISKYFNYGKTEPACKWNVVMVNPVNDSLSKRGVSEEFPSETLLFDMWGTVADHCEYNIPDCDNYYGVIHLINVSLGIKTNAMFIVTDPAIFKELQLKSDDFNQSLWLRGEMLNRFEKYDHHNKSHEVYLLIKYTDYIPMPETHDYDRLPPDIDNELPY